MLANIAGFFRNLVHILLGPRGQLMSIIMAGPMTFLMTAWLIHIVASEKWPETLRDHQLTILGYGLFGALGLIYLIILALSAGLIKGVRLKAGIIDASVDMDDEEKPNGT